MDKRTKRVLFMVEFTVEMEASVDPDDVTFHIPMTDVLPQSWDGKTIGKLIAYCTQQYPEVVE